LVASARLEPNQALSYSVAFSEPFEGYLSRAETFYDRFRRKEETISEGFSIVYFRSCPSRRPEYSFPLGLRVASLSE